MATYCYAYACGAPISGLEHIESEHERCTVLWDELVTIDNAYESAIYTTAKGDQPRLDEIEHEIASINAALPTSDDKKPLFAKRRELRAETWQILKDWRKSNKSVIAEMNKARIAQIKQARQETDAWWPNYNSVIARHEAARQVCKQTGRRLRFHDESRDDGMLAVQIQRTKTGLGASPEEIFEGLGPIHIRPVTGYGRRERRTTVRMRVNRDGDEAVLPLFMHRPLPEKARIKQVQLTWKRIGNDLRWQIALTLNVDDEVTELPYRRDGELVLMWEPTIDGGLKVAEVGDKKLVLPSRWMERMDHVNRLRARLDEARKAMIEKVNSEYRAILEMPERDMLDVLSLRRDKLPADIEAWRKEWKRNWMELTNLRRKLLLQRQWIYRNWAKEMVAEYTHIKHDAVRLDKIARADRWTERNALRHRACTHVLRQEVVNQADKIGAVVIASGKVLTRKKEEKTAVWARRKQAKKERSQNNDQAIDSAEKKG